MKVIFQQVYLVFLFLGVILALAYFVPFVWNLSPNISYRFVLIFLLLIVGSNLLAKIAYKYVNL